MMVITPPGLALSSSDETTPHISFKNDLLPRLIHGASDKRNHLGCQYQEK